MISQQLELPLFLPILKKRKKKKRVSRVAQSNLGDNIGWRKSLTDREQAITTLDSIKRTENEWRELVKQGKAKLVTERINPKTIKQHYELI